MILRLRCYVGDALLKAASVFARTGRKVLGQPTITLVSVVERGDRTVKVSARVPDKLAVALRIDGPDACEIVKVERVEGSTLFIDRPLLRQYAAGTVVKVLL